MKKIISFICLAAMLLTACVVSVAADGETTVPSLVVTALACDQKADTSGKPIEGVWDANNSVNADPFEFIKIKNTTNADIDLYDGYALGYNGDAGTADLSPTEKFRRRLWETTFIAKDFKDASRWDDTKIKASNPDTAVLKAGAEAYIWMFSMDSYKIEATVEQFRAFWDIPADTLVVLIDADSSDTETGTGSGGNFNMKNSGTGTYIICNFKGSTVAEFAADKVLTANNNQLKYELTDKTIDELAEVISYVVVDYDRNDYVKATAAANAVFNVEASDVSPKLYIAAPEASEGEVTTEAPVTTEEPTVTTDPEDETTEAPTTTDAIATTDGPAATTEPTDDEGGCGSVIGAGAVVVVATLGVAAIVCKKKED